MTRIVLLSAVLVITSCAGDKEQAPPAPESAESPAAAAANRANTMLAKSAATVAEASAQASAMKEVVTDFTREEMAGVTEKMVDMMGGLGDAIAENREDCVAMAAAVKKVVDNNKPVIDRLKMMQVSSTEEQKAEMSARFNDKIKANLTRLNPGKCASDPALMKLLSGAVR